MNSPKEVVAFYLQRIEIANHPVEKRIIKSDLLLYYYHLTDAECESVRLQMQPVLDEKQAEMAANDSLLKQAGELLNQLASKGVVVSN